MELTASRLLTHFDRLAETPDAVTHLRRLVLDLAVRGRIVEQNQKDEPASELLRQIETEKRQLAKAGEIKETEILPAVADDELAFKTPAGWFPTRLANIAACLDYKREPVNSTERAKRIEGKKPSQLFPYYGATQQQGWIDDYIFDEELVLLGEDGVPFLEKLRPKAYIISGKTWVNNHAHVFRGILISNQFLTYYLNTFDYAGRVVGATRSKLNKAKAVDIPIVLPPLAEQHRIVARVAELMAFCDQLETAKTERETRRDRLVASSLHRLDDGADAETFREHARFHLDHLPQLFTENKHIARFRQTVLGLAVRGKLVPQQPNDQPLELQFALNDRERHTISKKDRRADAAPETLLAEDERWDIPTTWGWRALSDLVLFIDYRGQTPMKSERGVRLVTAKNVKKGFINVEPEEFLTEETYQTWMTRGFPQVGDVLFTTEAPMGNAAVVGLPERFALAQRVICFRPYGAIEAAFLTLQLLSEAFQVILDKTATGLTAKGIKAAKLRRLPIAVPPITEQHRIVAKVAELMALCDRLETQFTTSQIVGRCLLEAVLNDTLAI